jgi:hypothetical protein
MASKRMAHSTAARTVLVKMAQSLLSINSDTGIDIAAICTQPDGSPPQADEQGRGARQPSQYGWNGGVVTTSRKEKHHA